MASVNLAGRLARIRALKTGPDAASPAIVVPDQGGDRANAAAPTGRAALGSDWTEIAPLVLRRECRDEMAAFLPDSLPPDWTVLEPSAAPVFAAGTPESSALAFFDLETTGLSGGAGTVAFMAAIGRIGRARTAGGSGRELTTIQFLLLDYPGEADFLLAALEELSRPSPPVLVTFNGKSFDLPLFRSRCLLNGLRPLEPVQLDLLHPGRRLWKRRLGDCSLVSLERALGLDRGPDLDGSEAPEAWFEYLKVGRAERLIRIAEHNRRDLVGLAHLAAFLALAAAAPESPELAAVVDGEGLALAWSAAARRRARTAGPDRGTAAPESAAAVAERLLSAAADSGGLRAALELSARLGRRGAYAAAEARLRSFWPDPASEGGPARDGADPAPSAADPRWRLRAMLRLAGLARRRRDFAGALAWLDAALGSDGWTRSQRPEWETRRGRWGG